MSATDETTEQPTETNAEPADDYQPDPTLVLELRLSEAEALRAWLLKPAGDGSTSLDDPLVSRALANLGRIVDTVRATANVRRELEQVGLIADQLTDEQVRELGRRVSEAALPGIRG